jgi:hypothetical protein
MFGGGSVYAEVTMEATPQRSVYEFAGSKRLPWPERAVLPMACQHGCDSIGHGPGYCRIIRACCWVGMRRLVFVVGLAVAAALLTPGVAAAEKPLREGLPAEDFTIEGSCAFDVDLHVLVNKEFITTFSDGRQLITGRLVVRPEHLRARLPHAA